MNHCIEEVRVKILAPIKRVIDPYVKIVVRRDGTGVEDANIKKTINPFDEIAIEQAVQWREQGVAAEVFVVSIGAKDTQESLRQALALGADQAKLLLTDAKCYPLQVATLLKQEIEAYQPDIVIMGKQAIDDDCNQVGQMLAGMLNWPQATFASGITLQEGGAEVTREVDGGLETIQITLPAIITTDLRLNEPRYPSLPNIMKAKKKPLEMIEVADLPPVELYCEKVIEPPQRAAGIKVESVDELLTQLRNEKVIA